ncbi:mevalonate kinase [Candidatus Nitrososphaera gargensis Ga9.2]|uniref:mevalonate kinase n=1 Tax=Nitrososphaera gargensis (strain Ga9.2) TaxID=1237085 RepID=K0IGT0_NITGG|nr:mevalonate kinase [Candidatus Nitrososphaera gargensis]AFU58053.1 mevalonate kinase [Candidatus Nitrososphaera gargensis Ga9.2]
MTKGGRASAPAKVILFGEHFVVYGNPAILASINRRITVDARTIDKEDKIVIRSDIGLAGEYSSSGFKAIEGGTEARSALDPLHSAITQVLVARGKRTGIKVAISSDVPPGIGLGSSAAACVATVAAVNSLFQKKPSRHKICEMAIESERLIHKNSSGADCYISTFGGLIHYSSKAKGFKEIRSKGGLALVVASTGVRHSTGDLVAGVMRFKERNESLFQNLAKQAADICTQAQSAMVSGRRDKLGTLMNENQAILRQIGVSHYKVDDLIDICGKAGALGAKITGAGGGGAVIALAATKQDSARIAARARAAGYESFEVEIDRKGLI